MGKEMSPFTTNAGFEHAHQPQLVRGIGIDAAGFSVIEQAPWVFSALSDVWELERSGKNIRGLGDFTLPADTAIRVRKLLSVIGDIRNLPAPAVDVFSGGGVTLAWELGSRQVKYTFWPEGLLTFNMEERDRTVRENELPDEQFNPREPVEWLLKR